MEEIISENLKELITNKNEELYRVLNGLFQRDVEAKVINDNKILSFINYKNIENIDDLLIEIHQILKKHNITKTIENITVKNTDIILWF